MSNDIYNSAQIYTDLQGVQKLKYSKNTEAAKKEVSEQFGAMLMQMLMRSMREATKAMSSGLFSNNQLDMYEDLFDKQIALVLSHQQTGLGNIFENNINQLTHQSKQAQPTQIVNALHEKSHVAFNTTHETPSVAKKDDGLFSSKENFIKQLWDGAKKAASAIGVMPETLLAQAALETNWGKNILRLAQGDSSHNLFNMKADSDWNKKTTTVSSLEYKEGELVKEKSAFKHYDSYLESFMDYMRLLTQNSRYQEAIQKSGDPKAFMQALQKAGFATDPQYADKVMNVLASPLFKQLISTVKNI